MKNLCPAPPLKNQRCHKYLYNKQGYLMDVSEESELLAAATGVKVRDIGAVCTVSPASDVTAQVYPTMSSEYQGKRYSFWWGCADNRKLIEPFRVLSNSEVAIIAPSSGDMASLSTIIEYPVGWPGWILRLADAYTLNMRGDTLQATSTMPDGEPYFHRPEELEAFIEALCGMKTPISDIVFQIRAHVNHGTLSADAIFNRMPV